MTTVSSIEELEKYVDYGIGFFFGLLESIKDQTQKRNVAQYAFFRVVVDTRYDKYDFEFETVDSSKEALILGLCKKLVGMFGEKFFTGPTDPRIDNSPGMTLDRFIFTGPQENPLANVYKRNREEILASAVPTVKSANKSASASAAQIRQALIRTRGDPKAATEMIMASGRLQDTYEGTKWGEIAKEFDQDRFDQDALGEIIDWAKMSRIADPWRAFWSITENYPDLYDRLHRKSKLPMLAAVPYSTNAPTAAELSEWTDGVFSPKIIPFNETTRDARVKEAVEMARQRDRPVVVFLLKNTGPPRTAFDFPAVRKLRKLAPDITLVFLTVRKNYEIEKDPFAGEWENLLESQNIPVLNTQFVVLNVTDDVLSDRETTQQGIYDLKSL